MTRGRAGRNRSQVALLALVTVLAMAWEPPALADDDGDGEHSVARFVVGFTTGSAIYAPTWVVDGLTLRSRLTWPLQGTLLGTQLDLHGGPSWSLRLSLMGTVTSPSNRTIDSDYVVVGDAEREFSHTESVTAGRQVI